MLFSATDIHISLWLWNYRPSNRLLWWWVLFTHTCSQGCCSWSDRGLSLHREADVKKITVTKHVAVGGNKCCQGANIDGWFLMWYFGHFSPLTDRNEKRSVWWEIWTEGRRLREQTWTVHLALTWRWNSDSDGQSRCVAACFHSWAQAEEAQAPLSHSISP